MTDANEILGTELLESATDIVAAYVSNNKVPAAELPVLIGVVHGALLGAATAARQPPEEPPSPAVAIRRSVRADAIICLEDGLKFKSLRRHLRVHHGMTPDAYRAKWGLPAEYPMVAPDYSAARSAMAKTLGLGRSGSASAPARSKGGRAKPRQGTGRSRKS